MLDYIKRFKNTGTIISLLGLMGLLLIQLGFGIDLDWLNKTINIVCSILVVLGICNNPNTTGLDLPTPSTKEDYNN
ncbi:hypothetical protein [Clostridium beijerinckii]|uniref:Bacteriophage holin n=1 Tax=Clostridium beijerinckii TaxID=1520 RepID=A0A1S8SF71_CLOBE|nr:hypothetical protein [Clostridium beijerinckii]NRY62640.1 phi LC3 family holin [Clostridium beijerinckii]OOM63954.1 bacteriophage holin [Clostridium beijerinckii]